ncbi:hypothetical protein [Tropicimonas sp. S265A]|uniref:hypothetical protein n=1 Tax=Tropicimonas sp. S265A TaxID=3415134 RepID=UPI003C7981EC
MRYTRVFFAALLAVILGITSMTMAVARGEMASGVMLHELCIDGEARLVAIGPDGAPVEDGHVCPDCVMGTLGAPGTGQPDASVSTAARAADPLAPPVRLVSRRIWQAAPARAPPSYV